MQKATFAGGCFWCTEAIFKRLKGVESVVSGYANSSIDSPSYEAVCSGRTGAAEAIQISFDPEIIPYEKLLEIFWHTHNPTTPNQQGSDIGTQYRSAIFYENEEQRDKALKSKQQLRESKYYPDPIVTDINQLENFYPAENYHQDYYDQNKNMGYCSIVIEPKIQKLLLQYKKEIKEEYLK
jgi:peptide-methionine (S)-S-oxide reductase